MFPAAAAPAGIADRAAAAGGTDLTTQTLMTQTMTQTMNPSVQAGGFFL
jgi:hypothetical protein